MDHEMKKLSYFEPVNLHISPPYGSRGETLLEIYQILMDRRQPLLLAILNLELKEI